MDGQEWILSKEKDLLTDLGVWKKKKNLLVFWIRKEKSLNIITYSEDYV